MDHTTSNKPAYTVAILILVISLYFVNYEGLSKVEEKTKPCPMSGASWIPRLELLGLNQSRIVKRCSPNYSDVVKVETWHWDIRLTELTPQVYNGECRNTPEVVVIAGSSEDVAEVVKFVRDQELELSVRSGGHSYACTSSRVMQHIRLVTGNMSSLWHWCCFQQGGVQLDLRGLNLIKLIETNASSTGSSFQLSAVYQTIILMTRLGCEAGTWG